MASDVLNFAKCLKGLNVEDIFNLQGCFFKEGLFLHYVFGYEFSFEILEFIIEFIIIWS